MSQEIECPECGEPMEEVWQTFCDADDNEAEGLVGYTCEKCGVKYNPQGEEMT
jgi:DNA-directed RNA polymerase subunit RPC12/RpoP